MPLLVRFRQTLLIPLAIIMTLLPPGAALAVASTDEDQVQWRRLVAEAEPGPWQQARFANLGFSSDRLEFQIRFSQPESPERRYLLLTPSYIDHISVLFTSGDATDLRLGDKDPPPPPEVLSFSGHRAIPIPEGADSAQILASTTSNLRLNIDIQNDPQLRSFAISGIYLSSALITFIALTAIIGLIAWSQSRSTSMLAFSLYQLTWLALLLGLNDTLTTLIPSPFAISGDRLVSYGAILATLFGALTHAQIFSEFAGHRFVARILLLVSLFAGALLLLLTLGYERQALHLNVLTISLVPLIVLFAILLFKPAEGVARLWKKIRFWYAVLMLSVSITGLSGVGFGTLFNLTYIHALLTTVILSYILISAIRDRRNKLLDQIKSNEVLQARRVALQTQLQDTRSMFDMLSHEIKTPLTTLSLLVRGSKTRDTAKRQIEAIQQIIEQTGAAVNLDNNEVSKSYYCLRRAVLNTWEATTDTVQAAHLQLRIPADLQIFIDRFQLQLILSNLISNAQKYSTARGSIRIFTQRTPEGLILSVTNPTEQLSDGETDQVFSKYWRSPRSRAQRGSGLGLWIVREIAFRNRIEVGARLKNGRFRLCLLIPSELTQTAQP